MALEEEVQKRIDSTIDSVELIERLNAKQDKTQDDLDIISRNVEHLKIVVGTDLIKLFDSKTTKRINGLIK